MCEPRELEFNLQDRRVAALIWGDNDKPLVLALHGWLDNAASFALLAPLLNRYQIVALDLAGHGRSQWRSRDASYPIWGYVDDLRRVQQHLGADRFMLLGHSLGAGVASLFSACWPQTVIKLALIENLGPLADVEEGFAQALRLGIEQHQEPVKLAKARPFEAWVRSRVQSRFPVPEQAAHQLMQRNTRPDNHGLYHYNCDPRLKLSSLIRLTEAQVRAALGQIECPVQLIRGSQGVKHPLTHERIRCVKNLVETEIEGGHHLHLEPGAVSAVADVLDAFYADIE